MVITSKVLHLATLTQQDRPIVFAAVSEPFIHAYLRSFMHTGQQSIAEFQQQEVSFLENE